MKKIIFMGTPDFARTILKSLIESEYEVIAVVTQPDKKVGRNKEIKYSEVKELALKHKIDVYQPENIRKDYQNLISLNSDIIVTAAYGQIIPTTLLDAPTYGSVNVHGSLLPKYRGGAPIHYAILNGETETGVTIMRMVNKMDAGNIISQQKFEIKYEDTLQDVYDNMKNIGASLLLKTLEDIFENKHTETVQNEKEVSYAYNISREDELLDFNNNAIDVYNKVRAFNPFPTCYFKYKDQNFKIYKVEVIKQNYENVSTIVNSDKNGIIISCKDYAVKLIEFQPQNKKRMFVNDYINGNNIFEVGDLIG